MQIELQTYLSGVASELSGRFARLSVPNLAEALGRRREQLLAVEGVLERPDAFLVSAQCAEGLGRLRRIPQLDCLIVGSRGKQLLGDGVNRERIDRVLVGYPKMIILKVLAGLRLISCVGEISSNPRSPWFGSLTAG
jgi:hypothetical protein